jgi:hypothetical protein
MILGTRTRDDGGPGDRGRLRESTKHTREWPPKPSLRTHRATSYNRGCTIALDGYANHP